MPIDIKRLSRDDRKSVILEAAKRSFDERGLDGLLVQNVAAKCIIHTSPSLIKYYFGGRVGLAKALGLDK